MHTFYTKLAHRCTEYFIKKEIIEASKKAIYQYGFEILISGIVYFIIFVLIALITNTVVSSILFWLGLFLLRKTSGGHHANNYLSCHLLFAADHLLSVILLKCIPVSFVHIISLVFLVFAFVVVLFLAPIDHKNKPFIKNEYSKFKLLSRIYCAVLFLIIVTVFFTKPNPYQLAFSFGSVSAAISLVIGKIERIRERRKRI